MIYFPTKKGKHKAHSKIFEDRGPKVFQPLECQVFSQPKSIADITPGEHPIVLFNHGNNVAMTDYACILEDLASHGYVVVAMQNQLTIDPIKPPWAGYSISKYAMVLDNNLFVFNWLKKNKSTLFEDKINLKKIALIGHSMGGNALLFLAHRTSQMFRPGVDLLLPHENVQGVRECIVVMDSGFTPPQIIQTPTFLCLADERKQHQLQYGTLKAIEQYYYKQYLGSKHVSFMDHGYVLDYFKDNPNTATFNGNFEKRHVFFNALRADIRKFMAKCGVV